MESKVILLGDASVGKSSLLMRFLRDQFNASAAVPTLSAECGTRTLGDRPVRLQLWDITGQDRFRAVAKSYYRGAKGCVLVCDQTDPVSLRGLVYWLREVASVQDPVPTLLFCNKSDQPTRISDADLDSFCQAERLQGWHRVSAKTGANVHEAFQQLAELLVEQPKEETLVLGEAPRRRWCAV